MISKQAQISDIIFDFDGTLIQSRDKINEINRVVFSEITGREVTIEEARIRYASDFQKLCSNYQISCSQVQEKVINLWGQTSRQFRFELFEGVETLLADLIRADIRLHLWTARDESSSLEILRCHDLEDKFVTMSFAEQKSSKPHADNLTFDWKSARENSVLLVGDSATDMRGAKNINAISVGALWDPYADLHELKESGADIFLHSITDMYKILPYLQNFKETESQVC